MTKKQFFECMINLVKDEYHLYGEYTSKIFSLAENQKGDEAIATAVLQNKDFDKDISSVVTSKVEISKFIDKLRGDNMTIHGFAHAEQITLMGEKVLVYITFEVDDEQKLQVNDVDIYNVIDGTSSVDSDGDIVKTPTTLVNRKEVVNIKK